MDTNEQLNSVNNSSAIGDVSVLTPSQKREQERLHKEQEAKEAAKLEHRRIMAEKRKAREAKAKKWALVESLIFPVILVIGGLDLAIVGMFAEGSGEIIAFGFVMLAIGVIWGIVAISRNK